MFRRHTAGSSAGRGQKEHDGQRIDPLQVALRRHVKHQCQPGAEERRQPAADRDADRGIAADRIRCGDIRPDGKIYDGVQTDRDGIHHWHGQIRAQGTAREETPD